MSLKLGSRIKKAFHIVRNDGVIAVMIAVLQKIQKEINKAKGMRNIKMASLVRYEDVKKADWSTNPYRDPRNRKFKTNTINWVMSPPRGGGGHQNIFRFIEHLDHNGYQNNIYLYSTTDTMTTGEAERNVRSYCKAKNLKFFYFNDQVEDSDVIFATGWETAYPVFNVKTNAHKWYFVQDFEPYFYPVGTNYILAENTYKFNFPGITAGKWLSEKLSKDYGMTCDYYNFGADPENYRLENTEARKEIFFYARPVTERRGFELGILTLEIFHEKMPEYVINLAGWDVSEYDIPFPYLNHNALEISKLSELYNKCAAALVISLTNMSLLPLELLACGTIPVMNSGPNNEMVSNNSYIEYTASSPAALAEKLIEVVTKKGLTSYSQAASRSVDTLGWQSSLEKFDKILEKGLSSG